jgi:sterol 3beta-glucosyltransferase
MRLAIFAIGSQGDVRPSAALGAGLAAAGHRVRLVTLPAFQSLAASNGMEFAPVNIDPFAFITGDIGQSWMNSMDKPHRLIMGVSQAAGKFLQPLTDDAVAACRGFDALLYNVPLSIAGHTVAEALNIPGIPTAVAPYHPTRAFPSIITPSLPLRGPVPNMVSGAVALEVLWLMFRSHMNKWRRGQSARGQTALARLPFWNPLGRISREGVPWLYGFSPSVIPAPTDWPPSAAVCGYWFTAPQKDWRPPSSLEDFLRAGPRPIYVGFGSMVGSNPERTVETVLEAVRLAGVRAVIASGWGGMKHSVLSDQVYPVESIPHDWLFARVAAAVHHGGAGTTAAALRGGVPSVIVPYFYDQFFWGKTLQGLGVAPAPIAEKHITSSALAEAIRFVTTTPAVAQRSRELSERIAKEDGVKTAVQVVERYLGGVTAAR